MKPEDKKPSLGLNINTGAIKETLLNFVVPLISILISALALILYVYPTYKSVPLKKEELNKKIVLEKTLNSKYNNLKKLVDFKNVLDENSDLVNKVLVNEAEVPKLLDQVNQISDNSGIELNRLSYSYGSSKAEEAGSVSFDTVSVALAGEFSHDQMVVFMESVENSARFVRVSNFRYSGKSGEDGKLSGSFSLDSPYLLVQSNAVTDEPLDLDISNSDFISFMNMIKGLRYYEFLNQNVEAEEIKPEEEVKEEEATPETVTPVVENITPAQ